MKLLDGSGDLWQGGIYLRHRRAPVAPPAPNQAPVAGPDSATVPAGETATILVLDNDADPEGGTLSLTGATAQNGTIAINADGTLAYTSAAGFSGTDTITYTIADPDGATSQGIVTVTVSPAPNRAPVAGPDSATVLAGQTATIPVLGNDADPEGGILSLTDATAQNGTVAINTDGTLAYTSAAGFQGTDTITYTIADPEGATSQGTVTVTVEAVKLSIEQNPDDGTLAINTETGEIGVEIIAPAEYVGSYSVDVADLAAGPINLVPPTVPGDPAVGTALTATPGLWVYDSEFAPLDVGWQWHRGSTPISGATGRNYVVQDADRTEGLTLVETAADAAGSRQAEARVLEPAETTPGPDPSEFVEKGVVFDGSSYLVKQGDLAPDALAVLWFASLTPAALERMGVLMLGGETTGLSLRETGRVRAYYTNLEGGNDTDAVGSWAPGTRLHILAMKFPNGDGSRQLVQYHRTSGGAWVEASSRSASPESMTDMSTGSFAVGCQLSPRNFLKATVYRMAVWAGTAVPDIRQPEVRDAFVSADGSSILDPAASLELCGPALVDVHGHAANYQSGLNFGNAGNFSSVTGTFTNA